MIHTKTDLFVSQAKSDNKLLKNKLFLTADIYIRREGRQPQQIQTDVQNINPLNKY